MFYWWDAQLASRSICDVKAIASIGNVHFAMHDGIRMREFALLRGRLDKACTKRARQGNRSCCWAIFNTITSARWYRDDMPDPDLRIEDFALHRLQVLEFVFQRISVALTLNK